MRKGDLVLIPFPFTDLSGQKVRPALILYASRSEDCIVAFISSRPQTRARDHNILVSASKKNGLKFDSIIKIAKIATLQKKIVIGKIGVLETPLLNAADVQLRSIFDLG